MALCRSSVGSEGLLSSLIPGPVPIRHGLSPSRAAACGGRGLRRGHPAPPDLKGVKKLTELMQAHRQWMSRAPDERFASLLDMQAFKQRIRNASNSSVLSSRALTVLSIEDDARGLRVTARTEDSALIPTHWSFGQLCSLASPGNSPASYFRDTNMPSPMIADCLNYNLRFTRGVEDVGILLTMN